MVFTTDHDDGSWSVVSQVRQSPPVDPTSPYSTASLAGKTILITGGASGFGAAFARHWAQHGSHVFIGDVNDPLGHSLIADLRSAHPSQAFHYQHCDVTSWSDQLSLFKFALANSPGGVIEGVVAGAGIADMDNKFDDPRRASPESDEPREPPLKVLDVNLTGVAYTVHLGLFYLARNGTREDGQPRDRHIMLISSIAGIAPLPGQTEYTASKHAVMGLFRALRGTSWRRGVRVNCLNPYFVDTPILPASGIAILAGVPKAELEDVVDAATRLMADEDVKGRALVIGPKLQVYDEDGETKLVAEAPRKVVAKGGRVQAVWEIYAEDFERVEAFVWRYIGMMNVAKNMLGWVGVVTDLWRLCVSGKKRR
ncbi:putative dehydrogenase [Triangularia verruculosa]|uniref:Dehydrogenase n=1 Tax=Triangularia verruculosa TaxID=2587418 RepID=A0AAN7ART8_9PEZI|nr:putative dehydrogenase [Triangularia verruculosa]